MQHLTEVGLQDSSALRQISYLAMAFLPLSFAAAFFGMNVTSLNPQGLVTVGQYVAIVVPLTLLTVWIVIGLEIDLKKLKVHPKSRRNPKGQPIPSQFDGDSHGVESDDETLEVRYVSKHQNRLAIEGETGMGSWARIFWPFMLVSVALDERRRRKKKKTRQRERVVLPTPSSSNRRAY